ncbi:MAG: hypothetical protein CJBNEKGG_01561 [Prosthecobacter sp.]|nr:hypothetical protein [Prosthecobacter sp.]
MNLLLDDMIARKRERRKELAALPAGEKLRMLGQILADTKSIVATPPPKPANPLRLKTRKAPLIISP